MTRSVGDDPLVSIVIPTYNAAATLLETMMSAGAQTLQQIEIIVVDDGSTDSSATIASDYCARDPRARLIRQRNGGPGAARNTGIAASRGTFVAPLDADDIWHRDKLVRQLAATRSGAGFVYSWSRDIDIGGVVWRDGPQPLHTGATFLRMLADNFVGNGSALLVRREAALAVGGYDAALRTRTGQGCEDILFQLQLARRFPAAVAPGFLIGYRSRPDAMSSDPMAMFRSWLGARPTLDANGPGVRLADRWGMARRRLLLAEAMAWRGRWGAAARHAAASVLRDPHRALFVFALRLTRRFSPRNPEPAGIRFGDLDPDLAWRDANVDLGRLRRLEDRRNQRLRQLETDIPY